MKRAVRITLLGVFAALGTGVALCVALRPEASSLPSSLAQIAGKTGPGRPASKTLAASRPLEVAAAVPAPQLVKTQSPAATIATPITPAAELPSQLTMAHQMGRLEEKLQRAEESAERQQHSIETALAAFHHQTHAATVSRRQVEPAAEDEDAFPIDEERDAAPSPPPGNVNDGIEPSTRSTPAEKLPGPPKDSAPQILPEEGDGRLSLNLRNSDLRQVLELLSEQQGMNIIASSTVQGTVTARLTNVDVDAALDAVLKATGFVSRREGDVIYVASPAEFQTIDHAHDRITTRVYRPNYITAMEMQTLLTPLITEGVGVISVSTAAKVGIPSSNVESGGDSFSGAEVVLVQDYESVLKRVDQLLLEVDVRPLQVEIETMIVTVTLDDSNKMGVNLALLRGSNHAALVSGTPLTDLANIPAAGALKFGVLNANLGAFIDALETVGDTNVVAAPRVMVLNKQRAEVLIGSQLGYVSTTVTENAATQSVEFLEVGTQLRIRPYISTDGMVRLEVHPELSTGQVDVRDGFTLPNKRVTQVTTNIMCFDGATVVIGGLIREDLSSTSTQIPLLGNIPWLGVAFRQRTEGTGRSETLVLLTPRIISGHAAAAEGAQGRDEFLLRQDWRYDKMNPLAQRNIGKQYLRKAIAAWNAGDAKLALNYVNRAIHMDPESGEAMNLRAEIVANSEYGDHTVNKHLREGLTPWHPIKDYSRKGYPWESTGAPAEIISEPHDPGIPGKIRDLQPAPDGSTGLVLPAAPPAWSTEEIPSAPSFNP